MFRGATVALIFGVIFFILCLMLSHFLGTSQQQALVNSAWILVKCFGPIAGIVVLGLFAYFLGHFDLGVLATVIILGPLTLLRPIILVLGAVLTVSNTDNSVAQLVVGACVFVMLFFEKILESINSKL